MGLIPRWVTTGVQPAILCLLTNSLTVIHWGCHFDAENGILTTTLSEASNFFVSFSHKDSADGSFCFVFNCTSTHIHLEFNGAYSRTSGDRIAALNSKVKTSVPTVYLSTFKVNRTWISFCTRQVLTFPLCCVASLNLGIGQAEVGESSVCAQHRALKLLRIPDMRILALWGEIKLQNHNTKTLLMPFCI